MSMTLIWACEARGLGQLAEEAQADLAAPAGLAGDAVADDARTVKMKNTPGGL